MCLEKPTVSRKVFIDRAVKELGMKATTASTYFHKATTKYVNENSQVTPNVNQEEDAHEETTEQQTKSSDTSPNAVPDFVPLFLLNEKQRKWREQHK